MRMLLLMGLITGLIANMAQAQESGAQTVPTVRIDSGALLGSERDGVRTFFGIPYAAPPIGELRWRAPKPVKAWQGTRSAEKFGAACMQPAKIGGMPLPPEFADMSEDCLYLNVWTPAEHSGKPLPVLVWVHGSGFIFGAGRGFGIDGSSFARNGVIVVSMNYRLGLFGHLAHPALASEATGGNYALLDQIAALQWVKRNIATFNGDPDRVTLAGLSAGGSYSQMLMTMPQAKGLFQQVISQSGPLFFYWPTVAEAQQRGAQALPAQTAEALRAMPAHTVAAATTIDDLKGPRPIIDGTVLRDHPARLLQSERGHARAIIVGTTSYEGIFRAMSAVPTTLSDAQVIDTLGLTDARIAQLYDPAGKKTPKQIAADIDGDRNFVAGARYAARSLSARKTAVYAYQFAYVAEPQRAMLAAAPHGSDQHFVFNQIARTMWGPRSTAADKAMADTIHGYWISFIKHGDPNSEGRPHWPRYDAARDPLLEFSVSGPTVRENHWRERLDAIEPLLLKELQ